MWWGKGIVLRFISLFHQTMTLQNLHLQKYDKNMTQEKSLKLNKSYKIDNCWQIKSIRTLSQNSNNYIYIYTNGLINFRWYIPPPFFLILPPKRKPSKTKLCKPACLPKTSRSYIFGRNSDHVEKPYYINNKQIWMSPYIEKNRYKWLVFLFWVKFFSKIYKRSF